MLRADGNNALITTIGMSELHSSREETMAVKPCSGIESADWQEVPKKNQSQDHKRIKNLPNADGMLRNVLAFGAKVTTRFCTEVATVLCSARDTNPKIFAPPSKRENRDKPSRNIVCALRTPSQNRAC